jgi:hypothetical protein
VHPQLVTQTTQCDPVAHTESGGGSLGAVASRYVINHAAASGSQPGAIGDGRPVKTKK